MHTADRAGEPVAAIIVGAGHRGMRYAEYASRHPSELRIVAVVDPDPRRRDRAARIHGIAKDQRFASVADLIAAEEIADVAINATMNRLHVPTSIALVHAGYDVLLEKPIGVSHDETLLLHDTARDLGRTVMICHVLRHAPFYRAIKQAIIDGEIGAILSMESSEYVSYDHMARSYVRGQWNNEEHAGSTMLMSKCCHDLDLIAWLKSGVAPTRVASAGSRMFFRPERAPDGAGTRCLADCAIEDSCPYSARKLYVDEDRGASYAWAAAGAVGADLTRDEKLASLREDNPYGRCVWQCDNTVVDHQAVLIEFADGATATHTMAGNSAKAGRAIKIVGTHGEIEGALEEGWLCIRHFAPESKLGYMSRDIDIEVKNEMHGGGDFGLVADLVRVIRGDPPSLSTTSIDDSIHGHAIGFAADESRARREWVAIASS